MSTCRTQEELKRPESLSLTQNKQRQPSPRRQIDRSQVDASYLISLTNSPNQTKTDRGKREILESTRREAQLAAQQYDEERIRDRLAHPDSLKKPLSPEKQSPLDTEVRGCDVPLISSVVLTYKTVIGCRI
ncbi:hypothetical protein GDO81_019431 [Engystomops pustulosus]|uniref:Supervillin n=1 Tax=Engystomops pustulosus TaxID=76066 RepID=A0AAV6YYZ6_ENGPU|nr:hypothetical protein GDO81_019461 [Engystomops pustulosus]KAG8540370.1 hypothetical protein GDO81_019431 [Engystomops pustulosus]